MKILRKLHFALTRSHPTTKMPRNKTTKQKKETRKERQNKEAKQDDNKSVEADSITENLNPGPTAVLKRIGNRLVVLRKANIVLPNTSTDNKSSAIDCDSDDQKADFQAFVRNIQPLDSNSLSPTLDGMKNTHVFSTLLHLTRGWRQSMKRGM